MRSERLAAAGLDIEGMYWKVVGKSVESNTGRALAQLVSKIMSSSTPDSVSVP